MVDNSSCTTYLLPSTTISITTAIILDTTAVTGNLTSLGSSSFIASSKPS